MQTKEINVLVLAYLGDSIYEQYIRLFLIKKGIAKVNDLQKNAVNYVSAKAQNIFLKNLIDNNILTEEELSIVKRARNHKTKSKAKNADIITYKHATAFEALIGYLYLENRVKRIDTIINFIVGD